MLAVMSNKEPGVGINSQDGQSVSTTFQTPGKEVGPTDRVGSPALTDRFLLAAGVVGPLFFFIVVLVEGAIRPDYNAWHFPISDLALGPRGWTLNTALVVLGAGLLCFAVGLRRVLSPGRGSTWGPILLALPAVAFILEAFFPTDPTLGYPPGAAPTSTLHGTVHIVLSVLFESPPIVAACIVLARRFAQTPAGRPWMVYSIATVILIVAFDFLGILAGLSTDPGSPFGLFQRLEIFTALAWIALVAGRLFTGPAL
jgi:hypothetical membrane protein